MFPSAVLYANRSIAHLKTECAGYALTDASRAIELDKTYVKGYYRRAAAYMTLGKFKQALKDFEAVRSLKKQHGKLSYCFHFLLADFVQLLSSIDNLNFQVVQARPNDKDAKFKHQECSKIVRKLAFEKAIAVDDSKKAIVDTIDIESMGKWVVFVTPTSSRNLLYPKSP